ncbi:hypothetical protein X963_3232 [Burkholderia pseudomallei MSHR7498]|nr:hypothetical protein X963_3232 [Burkholderia pseudomallei MSHR7498]
MGNGGYLTRRARFQAVVGLRQYDAWMAHRNGPKARQSCAAGGEARTLAGARRPGGLPMRRRFHSFRASR